MCRCGSNPLDHLNDIVRDSDPAVSSGHQLETDKHQHQGHIYREDVPEEALIHISNFDHNLR